MTDKKATTTAADSTDASDTKPKRLTGKQKFAVDFGPLLVFFAAFKLGDMFVATGTFMVAIVIASIYSHIRTGHVSAMQKFTFVVVMVLGGLTLILKDETFVKLKLTIVNSFFAGALMVGLMRGRLYIKMLMEMAFEMPDEAWRKLTRNYIAFFLVMAAVNEVIWRTQSNDFWVNFKTFGYMGINVLFIMAQMPMLMKYFPDEAEEKEKPQ